MRSTRQSVTNMIKAASQISAGEDFNEINDMDDIVTTDRQSNRKPKTANHFFGRATAS